ncbi:hypothetical protein DDP54_08440 [Cellulomonas sp. WB94]|uniref:hypothetical protein n=1 Tax=Cellulomonas sp. WB94 TaxID=2173174 RepID=UPI000D57E617|nr:hypothetical protein [Cellulomonas sp. WB94]PVU83023.1 hypothetical protein DDP54_08440 [Cellulomonas sp. WB94]
MSAAIAPLAARARGLVDEAGRTLARARQVDWVSDAADRYQAALTEGQLAVLRASALIDTAHHALAVLDAAGQDAHAGACTSVAQRLLGGAR